MTEGARTESTQIEPKPISLTPSIWRLVSRKTTSIVPFNESGRGPPIYCVHAIAGDVSSFQDIAEALRPNQRFFGIQVPQSKMNAEFCATLQDVATHHVDAVTRFQPDGPLILAGWSVGAIIALEMAQQLTASGRDVPLLIALDGAPCNTGAGLRFWSLGYMWGLARNVPGWLRSEVRESSSLLSFARRIVTRATYHLQTAFPTVRSEQTLDGNAVLRVLGHQGWKNQQRSFIRSLFQASRIYVPSIYNGKVIVYEATVQPLDHLLQVGAVWRKIAPHAEVVRLNGNHESIFRQPDVATLAEHLLKRLEGLRTKQIAVEAGPSEMGTAARREVGFASDIGTPANIDICLGNLGASGAPGQGVVVPLSESVGHDTQQSPREVLNGPMADDVHTETEVWVGRRGRVLRMQDGIG